ncbi:MAG: hypothetical protein IPL61_05905 [Myxococcales bacterium]|nr:hypothetical protein [Myxococcales bacterium]
MTWPRAIAALVLALGVVLGARGAGATPRLPITIERSPIVVRAEAGLERAAARAADRAERSLAKIQDDLSDLPRPTTIEIRIVADSADLAGAAPPGRGAPRWAAGVAYPDVGVLVLAVGRGGARHDLDKTLDHELAHLALGAAVPRAPRWLHEGFAWQHAEDLDFARIETLAGMAWFGSVIPLEELEWRFPAAEAPASRAYAESYDLVGYLAHRGRYVERDDDGDRYPFQEFLRALGQGKSLDEAAVFGFGVPMDELFHEWKSDLSRRYLLVPATVFATAIWLFAALLLILGYWRRRRRARATLARWADADAASDAARVHAPPAAPAWAEPDPLAEADPLDDPPEPEPPRWMN